jgi:hypothetical protein
MNHPVGYKSMHVGAALGKHAALHASNEVYIYSVGPSYPLERPRMSSFCKGGVTSLRHLSTANHFGGLPSVAVFIVRAA